MKFEKIASEEAANKACVEEKLWCGKEGCIRKCVAFQVRTYAKFKSNPNPEYSVCFSDTQPNNWAPCKIYDLYRMVEE